jgi:hypothetical protein
VAAGGPAARQGRHRRPPPCLVLSFNYVRLSTSKGVPRS